MVGWGKLGRNEEAGEGPKEIYIRTVNQVQKTTSVLKQIQTNLLNKENEYAEELKKIETRQEAWKY